MSEPMVDAPPSPPVQPPARSPAIPPAAVEIMLQVGGTAVAVWGAALLGMYGAFLTPFRLGGLLLPVSVVLAVLGNAVLIWFAYVATRHRLLAMLPSLVWIVLAFAASSRTSEGDIVLSGANWVGSVYLLSGAATIAVCAFRLFDPRRAVSASRR